MKRHTDTLSKAEALALDRLFNASGPCAVQDLVHSDQQLSDPELLRKALLAWPYKKDVTGEQRMFLLYFAHERIHSEAAHAALANDPNWDVGGVDTPSGDLSGWDGAPVFLRTLCSALGDRIPKASSGMLRSPNERSLIEQDLMDAGIASKYLPEYTKDTASSWSIVVGLCLRCGHHQLLLRTHAIDLVGNPDRLALVTSGATTSMCRACSFQVRVRLF
jgi:hypothetical protein